MPTRMERRRCRGTARTLAALLCLALAVCACKTVSHKPAGGEGLTPPPAASDAERLGDQYMANNMAQAAIPQFEKALAEGAPRASVAWRIGNAYFSLKKWPEALESFRQAIAADPSLAVAQEGAGYASFELGRFEDAIVFFEQAAELAPSHWVPHAFLAVLYRLDNNREQAQAEKDKTLALAGEQNKLMAADTIRRALNRAMTLRERRELGEDESQSAPQDLAALEAGGMAGGRPAAARAPAPSRSRTPDEILDPLSPDMDILGLDDPKTAGKPGPAAPPASPRALDRNATASSSRAAPTPPAASQTRNATMAVGNATAGSPRSLPASGNATARTGNATAATGNATAATGNATAASGNATATTGNATAVSGNATAATGNATAATGNATAATGNATVPAKAVPAVSPPPSKNYVVSTPVLPGGAKGKSGPPVLESPPAATTVPEKPVAEKPAATEKPTPEKPSAKNTAAAPADNATAAPPAATQATKAPAVPAPGAPFVYSLLESSWKARDKAVERANYLKLRGVRAQVMEADLGAKGLFYRVMIGTRQHRDDMKTIQKELETRFGLSGLVILRIPPGSLED